MPRRHVKPRQSQCCPPVKQDLCGSTVVFLTPSGSFAVESKTNTTHEACDFLDLENDVAGNNNTMLGEFLGDANDNDAHTIDEVSQLFDDLEQMQTQHKMIVHIPTIPTVPLVALPRILEPTPTATAAHSTPVSVAVVAPTACGAPLTRRQRVLRWQAKRHKRTWGKVNPKNEYYKLRMKTASKRKRVRGKFGGGDISWVSA